MLKFLKKLFLLAFIAGIAYGGYWVYTQTNLFKITTIEFTKHPTMDLKQIAQYTGLEQGDFYLAVNSHQLEEKIRNHPFVKTVSVKKIFPNKVTFTMTYRTHAFSLYYSDIVLSLDESLTVLNVLDEPKEGYIVEGFSFDSFSVGTPVKVAQKYVLQNIVLLIDLLNQSQLKANPTIVFNNDHIVLRVGDVKGYFGLGENISKKFNDFLSIYDALQAEGIQSGVIDVSSEGLPVFRPFGE